MMPQASDLSASMSRAGSTSADPGGAAASIGTAARTRTLRRHRRDGMTLVEVMMGMLVLSTALLGGLAGLLFSYRVADANLRSLAAISAARSVAEQVVAIDYTSLLGTTLPVDVPSSSVGSLTTSTWNLRTDDIHNTPSNPGDDLRLAINPQVTRITDSSGLDYVQVVIGVRWEEGSFFTTRIREDSLTVLVAPVSSY